MAISILNAASTSSAPSGTTISLSFDAGTASKRLLLVSVATGSAQNEPTSVTYNSVSMTKIVGYDDGYTLSLWYLVNPASGTNTITATFNESDTNGGLSAVVMSGVKQTSPVNTYVTDGFLNDNTDRGATITTTVAGCAIFNCGVQDNGNIVAGDASSTVVTTGYFFATNARQGIVRTATFPQTSAGTATPTMDGQTGSWGRTVTVAFEPATYTDVSSDLSTNLVSYWELEETSGTRVDSHGSNDLTDNNTVVSATGIQGTGADFTDTNSEYLSRADGSLSGLKPTTGLTISAWFKLDSTPGLDTIVAKNWNTSWSPPYASYHLRIDDATHITFLTAHGSSTNYYFLQPTVSTISASTWYHVALVFDSTTLKGYLNGSEVGSMSAPNDIAYSTGDLQIGRSATGEYFNGVMDEVGIWSRALSAGEVSALYNSGTGIPYSVAASSPTTLKTWNTVTKANVKTRNGVAIASIKTANTLT